MRKPRLDDQQVHAFLNSLFEEDLHARRVLSLAYAVLGVIRAASLGAHLIGKALAWARGTRSKHGVKQVDRRDRLLLVSALAYALLTLLGTAGESLGMERYLKANTAKTRTYSLFRQGCEYYQAIPMMPEEQLVPLIERFAGLLRDQPVFQDVLGPI